jgi:hypothetical protein
LDSDEVGGLGFRPYGHHGGALSSQSGSPPRGSELALGAGAVKERLGAAARFSGVLPAAALAADAEQVGGCACMWGAAGSMQDTSARASGRLGQIWAHHPDCPGIWLAPVGPIIECPGQVMVCQGLAHHYLARAFPRPKPGHSRAMLSINARAIIQVKAVAMIVQPCSASCRQKPSSAAVLWPAEPQSCLRHGSIRHNDDTLVLFTYCSLAHAYIL